MVPKVREPGRFLERSVQRADLPVMALRVVSRRIVGAYVTTDSKHCVTLLQCQVFEL